MNNDVINLITTYVQDGLVALSKRGAGKINRTGKTEQEGLAFIYDFDGKQYMVSIDPFVDASRPTPMQSAPNTEVPEHAIPGEPGNPE